jgi:hypothetical protein
MFEFTKDKIGTRVVLLPQDNAISRVGSRNPLDQAFEATITDVRRVKVELARLSGSAVGEYRIRENSNVISNDANFSYKVFADWDALNQYRSAEKVKSRLIDAVRGYGDNALTEAQLIEIGKLLGWDDLITPFVPSEN